MHDCVLPPEVSHVHSRKFTASKEAAIHYQYHIDCRCFVYDDDDDDDGFFHSKVVINQKSKKKKKPEDWSITDRPKKQSQNQPSFMIKVTFLASHLTNY